MSNHFLLSTSYTTVTKSRPAKNQDKILRFMEENGTARIDHIFVSEEFTPETGYITGAVKRMIYLPNEAGPERIEMSDHTLALATIRLS